MKSRRTKALEIPTRVKKAVWERDNERCILCGSPYAAPEAHYIPRSQGGLGKEENIVTLCRSCHDSFDNSTKRKAIGERIERYLKSLYPDWERDKQTYRKVTQCKR